MSELDRIKILIKWMIGSGIAPNQEAIGVLLGYKSKSSFSQIINGHVPLPKKFIESLYSLDNRVNKKWLLTGEGDMLIEKGPEPTGTILNEPAVKYKSGTDVLLESQARLISMQEQLMLNNTKLVETNSKITEQMIELFKKQGEAESRAILEDVKKEIENLKRELKNSPARGDAGCADVG